MPLTHDIGVRIPYPLQKALKFSALFFFLAIFTATLPLNRKNQKQKNHNQSPESVQSLRVRCFRRDKIAGIVEFS